MKILSFDTTNNSLSVAIVFDDQVIESKNFSQNSSQSEMLIPVIEECLRAAKIWYQDLDLIALTVGPGSFTGVRIGISAAKILRLAINKPVISLSGLAAMAYKYRQGIYQNRKYTRILAIIDAKLEELYIQDFEVDNCKIKPTKGPVLVNSSQIDNFFPKEDFLLCSNFENSINLPKNCISTNNVEFIDAASFAFLAKDIYLENNSLGSIEPLYIRRPKIGGGKYTAPH